MALIFGNKGIPTISGRGLGSADSSYPSIILTGRAGDEKGEAMEVWRGGIRALHPGSKESISPVEVER